MSFNLLSKIAVFSLFFAHRLFGIEFQDLDRILQTTHPFKYSLDAYAVRGCSDDEEIMICFHGYGSDKGIADILRTYPQIKDHLVSFNFPDYGITPNCKSPETIAYGTIAELLPALFILKQCVIDANASQINLYGFSAGGGAVINAIAVLNSDRFQQELLEIGIDQNVRKKILKAIENGWVVLDCPLKSIEEIIRFRRTNRELQVLNTNYQKNGLVPIDSLKNLTNLQLKIIAHFQQHDEALSNRDDKLFINRLHRYHSKGANHAVIGKDGGHISYHASLWKAYANLVNQSQSQKNEAAILPQNY